MFAGSVSGDCGPSLLLRVSALISATRVSLGLLGNRLNRSGVSVECVPLSFCGQQGAVVHRPVACSRLPRPSCLEKLGSVFSSDGGAFVLGLCASACECLCWEKVVLGDKNPFSIKLSSSTPGQLGLLTNSVSVFLNALVIVFPHLVMPSLGMYQYILQLRKSLNPQGR